MDAKPYLFIFTKFSVADLWSLLVNQCSIDMRLNKFYSHTEMCTWRAWWLSISVVLHSICCVRIWYTWVKIRDWHLLMQEEYVAAHLNPTLSQLVVEEWVNNCWRGWQNRTDLGKGTCLYYVGEYLSVDLFCLVVKSAGMVGRWRLAADLFQLKSSRSKVVRLEGELQALRSQCSEAQTQVGQVSSQGSFSQGSLIPLCMQTHT